MKALYLSQLCLYSDHINTPPKNVPIEAKEESIAGLIEGTILCLRAGFCNVLKTASFEKIFACNKSDLPMYSVHASRDAGHCCTVSVHWRGETSCEKQIVE